VRTAVWEEDVKQRKKEQTGCFIHFPYDGTNRIRFQGLKFSTSLSFFKSTPSELAASVYLQSLSVVNNYFAELREE